MRTLAIDQGTTTTRALIVNDDGTSQTLFSLPHQQIYPQSGWVEHDPEEILRNIGACLSAAGAVDGIGALGLDNQGESCLAWDARTKRPIGPILVWQDERTKQTTEKLKAEGLEPTVRERSGLPLDPYFSASKLAWLLAELPDARRLRKERRLRLGTTDAFFLDRLVGRFETDVTTASRTALMNLATCGWDDELCRIFGVPIEALPRIVSSTGHFGEIACGATSVPWTTSIVDQQASLYGHGCRAAGDAKITFGTGAFALAVTGVTLQTAGDGPLPTVAWRKSGERSTYALDGGVYAASSAVNWARGLKLFKHFAEIDAFLDRPSAIERGLVFVPALSGLACPHWDRAARGAWLGMSLDTTPSDLMQALLEGVALRTAEVIAAMERSQPLRDPISIDGGMTANPYFCQFLADVLGRELLISADPELTAVGTAALAAEAAGQPFAPKREGRRVEPQTQGRGFAARFKTAREAVQAFGDAGRSQTRSA